MRSPLRRGSPPLTRVVVLGLAVASAAVLLTLPASRARAWSCAEGACLTWCETPTYHIGRLAASLEDEAPGTTVTQTRTAVEDWTKVSCTGLDVVYGGRSGEALLGDGRSTFDFVPADWPASAALIGLTTRIVSNGCVVESDVVMNAENYVFGLLPTYLSDVHAYSAVLHEAGHFYGLGHSRFESAAMYFRYSIGLLEVKYDDEQGLCALYPGTDPPPDCAVVGCPSGQVCTAGTCVDDPAGACESDSDCIRIQRCNLANGKCENRPPDTSDLGAACSTDDACSGGICLLVDGARVCSETCDALDPGSCPDGFHCSAQASGDCALGVCVPGGRGGGGLGSPCEAPTDCGSLYCGRGRCALPCDPNADAACPNGLVCHPEGGGVCGSCDVPTVRGGSCVDSAECADGICLDEALDGAGFCTGVCASDEVCGGGFRCLPVGDQRLCMPEGAVRGGPCAAAPGGTPAEVAWWALLAAAGRRRRRVRHDSE